MKRNELVALFESDEQYRISVNTDPFEINASPSPVRIFSKKTDSQLLRINENALFSMVMSNAFKELPIEEQQALITKVSPYLLTPPDERMPEENIYHIRMTCISDDRNYLSYDKKTQDFVIREDVSGSRYLSKFTQSFINEHIPEGIRGLMASGVMVVESIES